MRSDTHVCKLGHRNLESTGLPPETFTLDLKHKPCIRVLKREESNHNKLAQKQCALCSSPRWWLVMSSVNFKKKNYIL